MQIISALMEDEDIWQMATIGYLFPGSHSPLTLATSPGGAAWVLASRLPWPARSSSPPNLGRRARRDTARHGMAWQGERRETAVYGTAPGCTIRVASRLTNLDPFIHDRAWRSWKQVPWRADLPLS